MNVKSQSDANEPSPVENSKVDAPEKEEKEESWLSFAFFVLNLVIIVLVFRSFIFAPFSIPSESMLPRLWNGDYLLASKWSYGYSSHSLPGDLDLFEGRFLASEPEPGDIVIFKHPIDGTDYIKRVIALPGDSIGMIGGQIVLNGQLVPKERIEDFIIPVSENTGCARSQFRDVDSDDNPVCRYPQFRETLPSGASYNVLDFGLSPKDTVPVIIVPEDRIFVMGDNRDNSQDSRFEAMPGGGVGLVPQDNLVGRATVLMWSTDGSAEWVLPWTWFTAARGSRIGDGL